jgi:uncharacterized membrane protein
MKPIVLIGLVLIVLGIGALAYQGFTYTTREKIIDIGPLQASADTQKTIPVPPFVGGLALVGGVVMVIMGRKKS